MGNTKITEEQRTRLNQITSDLIGAAIRVHTDLGPGLLENAYQVRLHRELELRGLSVNLRSTYQSSTEEQRYSSDIEWIWSLTIVSSLSLRRSQMIDPLAKAHPLSYLRLSNMKIGLLINFHCYKLTDGICRIINGY
jgi:GxxExxY protein